MAVLTLSGTSLGASLSEPALRGTLSCPQREDPGRVACELSIGCPASERIVWADALVRETPAFVTPLRARVLAPVAPAGAEQVRVQIAFVARELGRAEVLLEARSVLCPTKSNEAAEHRQACITKTELVRGEMLIGH